MGSSYVRICNHYQDNDAHIPLSYCSLYKDTTFIVFNEWWATIFRIM